MRSVQKLRRVDVLQVRSRASLLNRRFITPCCLQKPFQKCHGRITHCKNMASEVDKTEGKESCKKKQNILYVRASSFRNLAVKCNKIFKRDLTGSCGTIAGPIFREYGTGDTPIRFVEISVWPSELT